MSDFSWGYSNGLVRKGGPRPGIASHPSDVAGMQTFTLLLDVSSASWISAAVSTRWQTLPVLAGCATHVGAKISRSMMDMLG